MNSTGGVMSEGELASQDDFAIGALAISPSKGRAIANGVEARVEPRVMEVLLVLWRAAEKTVSRDQLLEACWGGRAVSDDALTRAVGKVRQLATLGGGPHFAIETLPKVGFRFTQQPPAGAAWVPPPATMPRRSNVHPGLVFGALALLTLAMSALFLRGGADVVDDKIITVSRFLAQGSEQTVDELAGRSRDAVVRMLSANGLRARAADTARDPSATGLEILGAVHHEGDYFVARVSIVDAADRIVFWSAKFDNKGAHGEGLDAQVGGVLADALKCAVGDRSKRPRLSRQIWAKLLNACADVATSKEQALDITKELLAARPDDADLLALRAEALASHANSMDQFNAEAISMMQEAHADATRAIALDPSNALAHVTLGRWLGQPPRYLEREENLKRARDLDPTAGRIRYVILLREVGRVRAALEIARGLEWDIDQRKQAEPQAAFLYAMTGDLVSAHHILDRIDVTFPEQAASVRATVALWWEDQRFLNEQFWHTYQAEMTDADCLHRYVLSLSGGVHRGLPGDCKAIDIDWRIRMLAREGDVDGAYALAQDGMPNSRHWMFLFYPEMKAFRHDARFESLVERLGLLDYWRKTRNWPDFCKDEAPISFCPNPFTAQ